METHLLIYYGGFIAEVENEVFDGWMISPSKRVLRRSWEMNQWYQAFCLMFPCMLLVSVEFAILFGYISLVATC
jgi:hypothetical protein